MSQINPASAQILPTGPAMGKAPPTGQNPNRQRRQRHPAEPDVVLPDAEETDAPDDSKTSEKPAHLDIKA